MTARQFSYIIPYRNDAQGVRASNLQAVLRWLSRLPDVEIVLVEQDRALKVTTSMLPANCTHVLAPNVGPFNKSWAFNVGFRHSSGEAVAFGDADLIVPLLALQHCFENCVGGLDAVKPYDRLIDLDRRESEQFLSGDEALTVYRDPQQTGRERSGEFVCFCGGLFMMRRNVYADLGGFDERFIGWGGEDDAMTIKLRRLVASPRTLTQSSAFHLWHERSHESRYQHWHYQQNVALLREYASWDVAELKATARQIESPWGNSISILRRVQAEPSDVSASRTDVKRVFSRKSLIKWAKIRYSSVKFALDAFRRSQLSTRNRKERPSRRLV